MELQEINIPTLVFISRLDTDYKMAKKRQMEVVRDTWKPLLEAETPQTHSLAPAGKKSNSRTHTQHNIILQAFGWSWP